MSSAIAHNVPLREWRKKFFATKPPPLKVLKEFIRQGKLAGEEVGQGTGLYVVHCDDNWRPISLTALPEPAKTTGNAKADAILRKYYPDYAST